MEREISLLSDDELNAVVGGRIDLANLGNRPRVLPPGSVSAGPTAPSYVAAGAGIGIVAVAIDVAIILAFF